MPPRKEATITISSLWSASVVRVALIVACWSELKQPCKHTWIEFHRHCSAEVVLNPTIRDNKDIEK